MDILEQAIEFEYSGHKLYFENAQKAKNPAVKFILNSLAEDELVHAEFLKNLKDGQAKEFKPSESMPKILDIIKSSSLQDANFLSEDSNVLAVLEQALRIEDEARSHYSGEATKELDARTRQLLEKLAREEEQHYTLISNLIRHLNNPQAILETPEFQYYEK